MSTLKTLKTLAGLAMLSALGGCASYDQETHQEVNQALDAATQLLQLVIDGVQMFGGR